MKAKMFTSHVWLAVIFLTLLIATNNHYALTAHASTGITQTIADFEGGIDSRSSLATAGYASFNGPNYAWENPPTPAGDDANYWRVNRTSASPGFVDYNLKLTPQNWNNFTTLSIQYNTSCGGGCNGNGGIVVYIHDAGGVGNNSGNGYHNLGLDSNVNGNNKVVSFNISTASNRGRIDEIKIRVDTGFFGSTINSWQQTLIWWIKISGTTNVPYVSSSSYNNVVLDRAGLYDYAPSIMNDGGVYKMWWCSTDSDGVGDAIYYAYSSNAQGWTGLQKVLNASSNTQEGGKRRDGSWANDAHTCDPSVVKVGNTYYMYYTASPLCDDCVGEGQIFLATSTDGIHWSKYVNGSGQVVPVIPGFATSGYGTGQSSVFFLNNKFYHYYTNDQKPGIMLATSYNGFDWYDSITFHHVSQNDGVPVLRAYNGSYSVSVLYMWKYNVFVAFNADAYRMRYVFSYDGINWQEGSVQSINNTQPRFISNIGILTDRDGTYGGSDINAYYGDGSNSNAFTYGIGRTFILFAP